jgi:hypothetical protein
VNDLDAGDLKITLGRRVVHRAFGNAGPVPGNVADATLNGKAHVVRACETPEFFSLHGCPHGRARRGQTGRDAGRTA